MLKVLDLFSGIGGFSLGLERAGMKTVAFCEIDEYARKVLNKHWPNVPIHGDINDLDGKQYKGTIDVICGGYPCQPFSNAGQRRGENDDRHLWPEYFRLIREIKPRWVIGENVAGHISMGLDEVLSNLESEGYAFETFIIPACAVDAPHRRDRVWIIANSIGDGKAVADTKSQRLQRGKISRGSKKLGAERIKRIAGRSKFNNWKNWPTEPRVGRVANGIPSRVDRIKCLGNSVVPQIPEIIGKAILSIEANQC